MELLAGIEWTDHASDYFLGRGATTAQAGIWHLGEWAGADLPDPTFHKRYGQNGSRLLGWYCWPLRTPANVVVGLEFRNPDKKEIVKYLVEPDANPHAIWTCTPDSFTRVWQGNPVWLVEGIFDALALQWAVPNTDAILACGRANLTRKQAESLRRLGAPYVHVVFDRDDAGQRGTEMAIKSLKAVNLRHDVVPYTGGKDPGEVWSKGGRTAVQAAFGQAV
jgi:hypothetical protein